MAETIGGHFHQPQGGSSYRAGATISLRGAEMGDAYEPEKMAKFLEGITKFANGGSKGMGMAETASRNKNVSGAADSGESRDGGTRAVSFSDPLRKTKSGLDKDHLFRALCSGLGYEADPEIVAMAKDISHVCSTGQNAEFLARGFTVAVEYYRKLQKK